MVGARSTWSSRSTARCCLTAREFRTLKDAIDEDRVAVQMRTADPLRLQLAGRLGIPARALPRPRVVAAPAPIAAEPPQVVAEAPAASDEDWPGETGCRGTGFSPVSRIALAEPERPERREQRRRIRAASRLRRPTENEAPANPPRRWLPVAAALVVLVVAALLGIRFVLPQAVVTIVPETAPVAAAVVFDVTTDGQPIDEQAAFALTPQQRQIEVVWEGYGAGHRGARRAGRDGEQRDRAAKCIGGTADRRGRHDCCHRNRRRVCLYRDGHRSRRGSRHGASWSGDGNCAGGAARLRRKCRYG